MIQNKDFITELNLLMAEIKTQNQDAVISIFGKVGSGKSTLAMNIAKVMDSTFNAESLPNRMAHTAKDFAYKQNLLNPYEVIIWDEAHKLQRRKQWDEWNKRYLDYFSDSRGLNQITILCFPNIQEIDRNIIDRSRMFLQAWRKGDKYGVSGWTKQQAQAKVKESRLFSPKTTAMLWAKAGGMSPKITFTHDLRGIEDEDKVYSILKKQNLDRTKATLAVYGTIEIPDICLQLAQKIKYEPRALQVVAYHEIYGIYNQELINAEGEGREPELERLPVGWSVKTPRIKYEIELKIVSHLDMDKKAKDKIINEILLNKANYIVTQITENIVSSNNQKVSSLDITSSEVKLHAEI